MKQTLLILRRKWRETGYSAKTMLTASFSSCVTIAFALWNGFTGLTQGSVWHSTICVYYLMLSLNRGLLLLWGRAKPVHFSVRRVYVLSNVLLLLMNLMLIYPIAMMTKSEKPVSADLIMAIAIAAYTTYKVSMAVYHLIRASRQDRLLIRSLRVISFVDAIVAVMSLQTTMITAVEGSVTPRMMQLSAWTNAGMFLLIMIISVCSFFRGYTQADTSRK